MEHYKTLNANKVLNNLPAEYHIDLIPYIQQINHKLNQSIVVLDDDPTGTQSVYEIPVLTNWSVEAIKQEFEQRQDVFYILTNSRSLPSKAATQLAREIGNNLAIASKATGREFFVISRSDSTLRGHYPHEVEALQNVLGLMQAIKILIPAFFEGGRYTINDIHYVKEGNELVPASKTPFAKDNAFGYSHSDLKKYVEEKTRGRVKADQVVSVSIDDLRKKNPEYIAERLKDFQEGATCIVNAASYRDLEVFAFGMLLSGRKVILRTAASIVPVLSGMVKKPLLSQDSFRAKDGGGVLIVVGSYVPKTTSQLMELNKEKNLRQFEVDVQRVLDEGDIMLEEYLNNINQHIADGEDVVVFTSRKLVTVDDHTKSLQIGKKVSDFMTALVKGLTARPKCILAKGGITSSDTATKGLDVKRAMVVGQVAPGIPVWKLGTESKFPGIKYIVFPGNVGDNNTLRKVYQTVRGLC